MWEARRGGWGFISSVKLFEGRLFPATGIPNGADGNELSGGVDAVVKEVLRARQENAPVPARSPRDVGRSRFREGGDGLDGLTHLCS